MLKGQRVLKDTETDCRVDCQKTNNNKRKNNNNNNKKSSWANCF